MTAKNILIIGPSRSGKTTLSRKLNRAFGYSIINLDDIVCSFEESFPELGIRHDADDLEVATLFSPFLNRYLRELSEGPNFYNGSQYVIEGVQIDFEKVMPQIDKDKYNVIGLVYNSATSEGLYHKVKHYDTEDDWTYYCTDEELKGNVDYFIQSNKYFDEKFRQYGIRAYDVSGDREKVLNEIIDELRRA